MVEADPVAEIQPIPEGISIIELFHRLEKECVGYEDYVNADEEHYKATLDGFTKLVDMVKGESIFSSNEELKDIQTENLKLLMVPFYEA